MYKKIKTGMIEDNKLQCVFILIYCKDGKPHKQDGTIPIILTINRHDGYIGFVGGKVEKNETLLEGLYREVKEEIGYSIDINNVKPLATYTDENSNIHSFKYLVDYETIKNITKDIMLSEHYGIEITGFSLNHIKEYQDSKGIKQLLKQNWTATSKLELNQLIKDEKLLNKI